MSAIPKEAANETTLFGESPDFSETHATLKTTHTSELVIALCGPIGSPLHEVAAAIEAAVTQKYGYQCKIIRLSDFISKHFDKVGGDKSIPKAPKVARVEALIKSGDEMRNSFGASVLADLAVAEIRVDRQKNGKDDGGERFVSRRICHIIDSIKNQAELDLLREVYREVLYVFGVFSPTSAREANMKAADFPRAKIHALMEQDAKGSALYGQTVGDTFPQSDFFLRMDTNSQTGLTIKVERYLDLILGARIATPTKEESAMYAAASAASSSACLSRQVGAAVTDFSGEVLAVGWNDVPKAFGGLYQTDRENDPHGTKDLRCYNKDGGKCFNDEEKHLLAEALIESMGHDIVPAAKMEEAVQKILTDKKLQGLIEFSRAIHAEMHAILNALKLGGNKVQGGSIFVTTYPCHGCARHIVASGIHNVYYIEPYRKSLATKLHGDAITESESEIGLVRLLPFEGVAPSRYLSIFQMRPNSRKLNGRRIAIVPGNAVPKMEKSLQSLPELEGMVVDKLVKRGLLPVQSTLERGNSDGPQAA
ncbi:anti-phage dCTP deaminase [Variovorax sp. UMC13]|uniref:anti-phage dCTP deaminase n=1 Tax=Variovorax sp. UMC13 TaxID=1862326 RepID=UPI001601753E|nr:anti-phage dCTP deaminase [Variovorax sp. UMC13]